MAKEASASIGAYCVIGANTQLDLVTIGNRVLIERDCVLEVGCVVYECCYIRAGTVIPSKKIIPPESEVSGIPGVDFEIIPLNSGFKRLIEREAKQLYVVAT